MPSAGMPSRVDTPNAKARAYELAIKRHNDPEAMVSLAELLFSEQPNLRDVSRAIQLLQRAIKQHDDPTAMNNLALFYLHSNDAAQRRQVIPLLERSLRKEEDTIILRNLSDAVNDVRCGTPRPKLAVQLCERSLRFGDDPKCMEALAFNLLTVKGIKTDNARAINLFKKAIRISNDAEAMNRLGMCYWEGTHHLPACAKRAARWFEKSIQAGNFPVAKRNLAYLLAGDELPPSKRDPERAVRLMEDAIQQVRSDTFICTLAKIYRDVEQVQNFPRAIQLWETSLIEFNSNTARVSLLDIFLGFKSEPADHPRALQFCREDYARTKDIAAFRVMCCILWSGARNVKADAQRAVALMRDRDAEKLPEEIAARRFECETDEDMKKLMEQLPGTAGFYGTKFVKAIVLSESQSEESLQQAESIFREIVGDDESQVMFAWLPLSLRMSSIQLPFDGDPKRMTYTMKRATHCYEANLLNLASVVLEKGCEGGDKKAEVVKLLEEVMDTGLRVVAMVNLGYILWTGVGGIPMDRKRAMQLLESCVEEADDACARALLASALVDSEEYTEEAMQRSMELWKSVEEEFAQDEEEISRMRWMLSERARNAWASRAVRCGD